MNEYVDIDVASELAGVEESYITEVLQTWVRERIDLMFGRTFQQEEITISDPEIHSIKNNITDTLVLNNFPVVSITRLRNDIHSNSPYTLDSSNYHLEKTSGILKLIYNYSGTSESISYFSKGTAMVDVAYVYGFSEVPEGVKVLANWIAAKLAKYNQLEEAKEPGIAIDVTIGDYKEKRYYEDKFKYISDKYNKEIESMKASLNQWRRL